MKVNNLEGKELNLPDFLIVGTPKGGTTSLYNYLREHPHIFMPDAKEPFFFAFMDNPPNFINYAYPLDGFVYKLEDYVKLFEDAKECQIMGEASTRYLVTPMITIENIKKVYGDDYKKLKIIIILRNPVERARSHYTMLKWTGMEPLDFWEAIKPEVSKKRLEKKWSIYYDYIYCGMYYEQVKAYIETFENVKIFFFEDLENNALAVVNEMFQFLKVDSNYAPTNIKKSYNISVYPRTVLVYPLFKFTFLRNTIRAILNSFLSENVTNSFMQNIRSLLIKKKELSKKQRQKIVNNYYKKDLEHLLNLNLPEIKKNIIRGWLKGE